MVRDAIKERVQEQVDELEEEQQRDEREVLDGLGAHHRRATEDEQEDPQRDDDECDDAELDVVGAGGGCRMSKMRRWPRKRYEPIHPTADFRTFTGFLNVTLLQPLRHGSDHIGLLPHEIQHDLPFLSILVDPLLEKLHRYVCVAQDHCQPVPPVCRDCHAN